MNPKKFIRAVLIGIVITAVGSIVYIISLRKEANLVPLEIKTSYERSKAPKSTRKTFKLSDIKVGDSIKGMTITSVKPIDNKRNASSANAVIEFRGQAIISGRYQYVKEGLPSDSVCFDKLDAQSIEKIPFLDGSIPNNANNPKICLANRDVSRKAFVSKNSTSGSATIVIDNYTIASFDNGDAGGSSAELIRVVNKATSPN